MSIRLNFNIVNAFCLIASACQRHIECSHHPRSRVTQSNPGYASGISTYVHVVEALVDAFQSPGVSNKFIHPEGSVHVVWRNHVRRLKPYFECSRDTPSTIPGNSVRPLTPPNAEPFQTRPVTSWNLWHKTQPSFSGSHIRHLRPRADLCSSRGNADNGGDTPALVTGFQSLSHDLHISCGVKGEVATTVRHLDQLFDDSLSLGQLLGVDKVGFRSVSAWSKKDNQQTYWLQTSRQSPSCHC